MDNITSSWVVLYRIVSGRTSSYCIATFTVSPETRVSSYVLQYYVVSCHIEWPRNTLASASPISLQYISAKSVYYLIVLVHYIRSFLPRLPAMMTSSCGLSVPQSSKCRLRPLVARFSGHRLPSRGASWDPRRRAIAWVRLWCENEQTAGRSLPSSSPCCMSNTLPLLPSLALPLSLSL